jgi:2-(1,2-epoxy-1,2-dihydrophenyl)acetyl-CoA isomerase
MPESPSLHTDLTTSVLTLVLDRPPVNALSLDLIAQILEALKTARDDPQIRCVVITGHGDHFSAGQDIHAMLAEDIPFRYHMLRTYNPLIMGIRSLPKPVLASVNGMAAGAGLGIALACDLRLASDRAQFVVGFTGIGLVPDSASSLLLPTLIGLGRALEFTFSNAPIDSEQALAWGMVNRVIPHLELMDKTASWAAELAQGPTRAYGLSKRAFNHAMLGNLEQCLDYEAHLQEIASRTPEHKEGVRAFLEKRSPDFFQS